MWWAMPVARHFRRRPGFTLIELLTVLAVIAILGAMTVGAMRGARQRTDISRAKAELAALATALEGFRRHHGDYPQLGGYRQAAISPDPDQPGPRVATVQAKLFNCLTGVLGVRGRSDSVDSQSTSLLDPGRFSLEGRFDRPSHPPREQDVALLDPWGRRYRYYYKDAAQPATWRAAGYILYSAGPRIGPEGSETPPLDPATGLMRGTDGGEDADNLYANP